MVYEVFARKWRPQIFQDVIGQEHVTRTLINSITEGRLHHAYLFSGARGVGKTSVARIFAKALNCQNNNDGNPCNKCNSCLDISAGSSLDVQEIDGASNRGIDEIRDLRENIQHMSLSGRYRIYIIDEVHMLTLPAFNALLKTLEEPPSHVKFIFATTEPHKVPVTILSRCQRFDFKRIPQKQIMTQLQKITDNEGIEISRTGLAILARESEGSMRDAESLLDQVASFKGSKIVDSDITEILGIVDRDIIFESSEAIINGQSDRCVDIVNRIYNYGYDVKEFYKSLMDQFRDLMISLVAPDKDLTDMTEDDRARLRQQAEKAGLEKIEQCLNILIAKEEAFRYSSHTRLVLETIMIKLSQLGDMDSFGELLNKLKSLEKYLRDPSFKQEHSAPGKVSEPEAKWNREEKKKKITVKNDSPNEDWDSFLKYLSSKNKAMHNILKEWRLKGITKGTMELIRGGSPFASRYLDDPENTGNLKGYLKDFYGKKINILVTGEVVNNNSAKTAEDEKPDLPRPVKEVLEVFKGQIMGEVNTEN
jgi:DNA polymerase-3 subunit gamma/tau